MFVCLLVIYCVLVRRSGGREEGGSALAAAPGQGGCVGLLGISLGCDGREGMSGAQGRANVF